MKRGTAASNESVEAGDGSDCPLGVDNLVDDKVSFGMLVPLKSSKF
jgi:hypothetical protein